MREIAWDDRYSAKGAKLDIFKRALIAARGNISMAARACRITRMTAYAWIKNNKSLLRLLRDLRNARKRWK